MYMCNHPCIIDLISTCLTSHNRIDVKDTGNNAEKFLAVDLASDFPRALVPLPRGLDVQECVIHTHPYPSMPLTP